MALLLVGVMQWLDSFGMRWTETAFTFMADGGILAVFSAYVIIYSYIQAGVHEDCAKDLCLKYGAILELPKRPSMTISESCCEWTAREVGNLCVDFLSSSRLLMAWTEDWPQVIIALVLLLKGSEGGFKVSGLLGMSVVISLAKGLLIPSFQQLMFEQRKAAVESALHALVASEEGQRLLVEKLLQSSLVMAADLARSQLQELLLEPSTDVLKGLHVWDSQFFQPLHDLRERWLEDVGRSEDGETVRQRLVAGYLQWGITPQQLFDLGHMSGNCKSAGFTVVQCKEIAKFSAKDCKEAGFSLSDCLGSGYPTAAIRTAGFSASAWKEASFTANQCKDAGFSAKECLEAGYSWEECRDAGFSNLPDPDFPL